MSTTATIATLLAGVANIASGQGLDGTVLSALQAQATVQDGIAWVKAIGAVNNAAWTYEAPFNDRAGFVDIAQYATSIKFVSGTGTYTMWANECSNPVWNLNNGYELSYTTNQDTGLITGFANTQNWQTDTTRRYMTSSCYDGTGVGQPPRSLTNVIYHACGTGDGGLHVFGTNGRADMNGKEGRIDVYLGFDEAWSTDCYGNSISARDCSILAIDNFLLHCSDEFAAQNGDLDALSSDLTALDQRVGAAEAAIQTNADSISALQAADSALEARATQNEADIAALQTELSSTISDEIAQLQDDVAEVNARIDLFASFAAQSAPGAMIDGGESASSSVFSSWSMKDTAMFSLLTMNLVLMMFICCREGLYKTGGGKRRKYVSVAMNDESDINEAQAFKK
jgi:hypothetical protein